jgi:hypothetical protein
VVATLVLRPWADRARDHIVENILQRRSVLISLDFLQNLWRRHRVKIARLLRYIYGLHLQKAIKLIFGWLIKVRLSEAGNHRRHFDIVVSGNDLQLRPRRHLLIGLQAFKVCRILGICARIQTHALAGGDDRSALLSAK